MSTPYSAPGAVHAITRGGPAFTLSDSRAIALDDASQHVGHASDGVFDLARL
jgi:hypothetical protein